MPGAEMIFFAIGFVAGGLVGFFAYALIFEQ
jgi:hypothetical protein